MRIDWQRHWRIFLVYSIEVMHFRLRAVVWFLVGSVNTIILLLYWLASLRAGGDTHAQLPAITSYYLLMLATASITMCHHEGDIAVTDIQKGELSKYLLLPYPYLAVKFHQEVVWRLLMAGWAAVLLIILAAFRIHLEFPTDPRRWGFIALSILIGTLVSFFLKSLIGLTAIWLTNIRGLLEFTSILEVILTGFVIPLHMLPQPWQNIALFSPFASITYTSVHMMIANPSWASIQQALALQLGWLIVLALGVNWFFRFSIRHYTGVSQ